MSEQNQSEHRSQQSQSTTTTTTIRKGREILQLDPAAARRLMGWHWYDWLKTAVVGVLGGLLLLGGQAASTPSAAAPVPAAAATAAPVPTSAATTAPPPATATAATALPAPATPVARTLEVQVAYTVEKADWLLPQIERFNQERRTTADGAVIQIVPLLVDSADEARIAAQDLQPDVWFPASSLRIPAMAAAWQAAGGGELTTTPPISIVQSPVVLAMWEPMARLLGWPERQPTWQQLADGLGRPWDELGGEAQWGPLSLVLADPATSASGLSGVLGAAAAGVGKTEGLTATDLDSPAMRLLLNRLTDGAAGDGSEAAVNRLFDCATTVDQLSGAVVYEQQVATQPACPDRPRLVAVYPENGTVVADHPYLILNGPWVDAGKQDGARVFADWLREEAPQQSALAAGYRPVSPGVALGAPIVDAAGVSPAQPAAAVGAPPAEVVVGAAEVWQALRQPLDVFLVVDTSGSMDAEGRMEGMRTALLDFIDILGTNDRLQLVAFSTNQTVLTELAPLGPKRAEVAQLINGLTPGGATLLYDTTIQAVADLQRVGEPARTRTVIVLTDGRDERLTNAGASVPLSQATLEETLAAIGAAAGEVKLVTISYGSGADAAVLQRMAEAGGGQAYVASPDSLREIYETIALFP